MILNGWKDISRHLKCGVRTAQRWHQDLHLPVMSSRDGRQGPVMAESSKLDDWVRQRKTFTNLSQRTSGALARSTKAAHDFLITEIATGREFARLAMAAQSPAARSRRTRAAREAYDTLERMLSRKKFFSPDDVKRFKGDVRDLKRSLQELGEKF